MTESLTTCNGCGMYRLCQEHKGLWLCVDGPSKCYRRRKIIKVKRKENGRE